MAIEIEEVEHLIICNSADGIGPAAQTCTDLFNLSLPI
jgi:hypothetical protein